VKQLGEGCFNSSKALIVTAGQDGLQGPGGPLASCSEGQWLTVLCFRGQV
jgi:hypothetical protein